jgi:hypothetical protein
MYFMPLTLILTCIMMLDAGAYICRDALKVDTPQGQWAEWLIASPLLGK